MKTCLALAQINCMVGDFAGNSEKIFAAAQQAQQQGARVLLTPELALSGYPPEDWLLRPGFYVESATALNALAERLAELSDLYVIVGHPHCLNAHSMPAADINLPPQDTFNAASLLFKGEILGTYYKQALPNTSVFDEERYFASGNKPFVFTVDGVNYGLLICEDIWASEAALQAKAAGAQALLVINGSPYHLDKVEMRREVLRTRIQQTGLPIVYLNLVGAQDELVFDGASFVLDGHGKLMMQMSQFVEEVALIEFAQNEFAQYMPQPAQMAPIASLEGQAYAALVLGVRDYCRKNGFTRALIGLSGGVDSALTLAIACDALGCDAVRTVMMPSPYTADISLIDAREMAERVGVRYDEMAIAPLFEAFHASLAKEFEGLPEDQTEENLQARIRGTLLMALSNKYGSIVLSTGNKSEMAVGYCTLYGDMAGGFAVLKDIAKTLVYRLCRYRNTSADFATHNIIPERILTRAPSAELRANQTDQDSLPPYEILDAIVQKYVEENQAAAQIVAAGYQSADVARVISLIHRNEYKRRQAPPGSRITPRAFGRDWRYPIAARFSITSLEAVGGEPPSSFQETG